MDYYPNPDSEEAGQSKAGDEHGESREKEKMEGETALIPKSLLAGKEFKPGDELVLKIVHIYDDELEVAYASEKPSASKDEEPADMEEAKDRLDMLAT